MKTALRILIVLIAAVAFAGGGCDRPKESRNAPAAAAEKTEWTAEEIAGDPAGYLRWSDRRIEKQIQQRQAKLDALNSRRAQIEEKQKLLAQNITDVENIRKRLAQAYQQAEDEDRWPVRMAGRTFERTKAQSILEQTRTYVEERRPMLQTYDESLAKMDGYAATIRQDIKKLQNLREKLALDLEQVQLNQNLAEMEKWRKQEAELAAMGRMLGSMNDDPMIQPSPREPPGRVDIEQMLK